MANNISVQDRINSFSQNIGKLQTSEKKEKMMTTKQIADSLNVNVKTINNTVNRLLGSTFQKSEIKTLPNGGRPSKIFTEKQASIIKQEVQKHHNLASRQIDNVTTESETLQKIQEGYSLLLQLANSYKTRAEKAEKTNAILMHVNKTYTATEIAKEIGLRSANELNQILEEKKIQYKQNGTWIPFADYADCGYFEIKQEVLDNGKVIYHRKITQLGRKFILNVFKQADS